MKEGDWWYFEVEDETGVDTEKGVYILAPLRKVNPTTQVSELRAWYADQHPNLRMALMARGAVRVESIEGTRVFVPLSRIDYRAMHVSPDGRAQTEGKLRTLLSVEKVAQLLADRPQSRNQQIYWVPALHEIILHQPLSRLKRVTHNLLWLFGILREESDNRDSLLEAAQWLQPRAVPKSAWWTDDDTGKVLVVKYTDLKEVLGQNGANILPLQMVFKLNSLHLKVALTKEGRRWHKQSTQPA
jgi:hypothetical protein